MRYLLKRWPALVLIYLLMSPSAVFSQDNEIQIKQSCIKATIKAVEMEIQGYENRLKTAESGFGPVGNVEKFKKRLTELKSELEQFKSMKIENYREDYWKTKGKSRQKIDFEEPNNFGPVIPPVKEKVTITVKKLYKAGSLLDLDDITRSGPFYHVAAIKDGDYGVLKPGKSYQLEIYLVYKKEYVEFISAYYAYVAEIKEY